MTQLFWHFALNTLQTLIWKYCLQKENRKNVKFPKMTIYNPNNIFYKKSSGCKAVPVRELPAQRLSKFSRSREILMCTCSFCSNMWFMWQKDHWGIVYVSRYNFAATYLFVSFLGLIIPKSSYIAQSCKKYSVIYRANLNKGTNYLSVCIRVHIRGYMFQAHGIWSFQLLFPSWYVRRAGRGLFLKGHKSISRHIRAYR